MTVRPVDMQTLLPRLNEAGRMQHATDRQPQVVQQVQAAQGRAQAEHAQQQVLQKPSAGQVAIRQDGKGKGSQGDSRDGKQPSKERPQQAPEAERSGPTAGHRLDVKV